MVKVKIRIVGRLVEGLRQQTVWDEDGFADFADCVMSALVNLECEDPDVTLDFEEGTLEMCATVEADNSFEGHYKAISTLRSAIHGCGGATPGWESVEWEEPDVHSVQPSGHSDLVGA